MAKKESDRNMDGQQAAKARPQKAGEGQRKSRQLLNSNVRTAIIVAVLLVVVFAVFYLVLLPSLTVPFSTFKSNFASAPKVAIVVTYTNSTLLGAESNCADTLIYVVAQHRNASSIGYYVMNQTACTYPIGGLGHTLSVATNTTANCLSMIGSEPAVYLNSSISNRTLTQTYKFYVYGNAAYFGKCPVAVDLS